jgi:acyl-CoA thioester hydrolase
VWAEHRDAVRPEWLDGNGHMNLAYYVVVFDRGADAWLDMAGLGAAYRAQGGTVFAVETHTIYRREVGLGTALLVRSRLVAAAGKRIHLLHEMHAGPEEVALQEVLYLHVDLATRRAAEIPPAVAARLQALAPLPGETLPAWLGRAIGQGPFNTR